MMPHDFWKIRLIVFVCTLGAVGLLAGLGALIDGWFGTRPWGVLVGALIAFPIAEVIMVIIVKRRVGK